MDTNDKLVRSLFDAIDARDWDILCRLFTTDLRYDRPGFQPIRGVTGLVHFYRNERGIAAGEHAIERILTDHEHGFCWGRFTGRSYRGEPLDELFADWYLFDDERIRARRSFFYRPAI